MDGVDQDVHLEPLGQQRGHFSEKCAQVRGTQSQYYLLHSFPGCAPHAVQSRFEEHAQLQQHTEIKLPNT